MSRWLEIPSPHGIAAFSEEKSASLFFCNVKCVRKKMAGTRQVQCICTLYFEGFTTTMYLDFEGFTSNIEIVGTALSDEVRCKTPNLQSVKVG